MLSIIIPTFKEGKIIQDTIIQIVKVMEKTINYEVIVIDDNSKDGTINQVQSLSKIYTNIHIYQNNLEKGFGNSLKEGIKLAKGEYICFVMADQSDDPLDIIEYYNLINSGEYDCVFGDRWSREHNIKNYPKFKFFLNRIGNNLLAKVFNIEYTDITNSFKMYKKDVLENLFPLISNHFSITIEIPLKIIYRGYRYKITSNSWQNNQHTISNLNLWNVVYTYSLILIYCRIEKYFMNSQRNKKNVK